MIRGAFLLAVGFSLGYGKALMESETSTNTREDFANLRLDLLDLRRDILDWAQEMKADKTKEGETS